MKATRRWFLWLSLLKRVLPPNPGRWFLRLLEIYLTVAAMLAWVYFAVVRGLEGQITVWEWPLLALVVIAFYHLQTGRLPPGSSQGAPQARRGRSRAADQP